MYFQIVVSLLGMITGPLLGMFLLGGTTKIANSKVFNIYIYVYILESVFLTVI